MIVLGIESAGPRGSVALLLPDQVMETPFGAGRQLGAELAPAVQSLMLRAKLGPDRPPALVAVNLGPGSYTGLRIGLAAAKGLAFAWSCPLVGVPQDEALLAQAPASQHVLCALNASRGEIYATLYARSPEGFRLVCPGALWDPQELSESLQHPTLVIGDAAKDLEDPERGIVAAPPELAWPSARCVAEVGLRMDMDSVRQDPLRLSPIYFRPNEAEEQRRKRSMRSR